MLNIKETVVGIDVRIQALQKDLFYILCEKWGISEKEYESYGRVYKTEKSGNIKPQAYAGKGEYRDVFSNDKVAVQSFFGVADSVTVNDYKNETANVHLVFGVNLSKIKCEGRKDAEVRRDVFDELRCGLYGFELQNEITGVNQVFTEYNGEGKDAVKFRDMQPYHYFRFNLTCEYDPRTTTTEIAYETTDLIN